MLLTYTAGVAQSAYSMVYDVGNIYQNSSTNTIQTILIDSSITISVSCQVGETCYTITFHSDYVPNVNFFLNKDQQLQIPLRI